MGFGHSSVPTVADLLEGHLVLPNLTEDVRAFYKGKPVLVTGACGSIGWALFKVLEDMGADVVGIDHNEGAVAERIYNGQERLIVGHYLDAQSMLKVLGIPEPLYIFHCAAYKHVRLSKLQAPIYYKNNCGDVFKFMNQFHNSFFVLASSDKAAGNTELGKSKRMCENIVVKRKGTALRMVNALASSGSVLDIWLKRIDDFKKPEVVKGATRYFMQTQDGVHALLRSAMLPYGLYTMWNMPEILIEEMARSFLILHSKSPDWYTLRREYYGEALTERLMGENEVGEETDVKWLKRIIID